MKSYKVIPKILTATLRETVQFVCVSAHNASWTFSNGTLPSNAIAFQYHGSKDNWLKILDVHIYNQGKYICSGSDEEGYKFESHGKLILISM